MFHFGQVFLTKTLLRFLLSKILVVPMMGDRRAILTLLLILCFAVASISQIKIVKADNFTIHIREDGSITGTDKIYRSGNVYIFIADINSGESPYGMSIEKNNIVVEGLGHTLQGNYNTSQISSGISIMGVHLRASHVTIKNLNIKNYHIGIQQNDVSNNYIADNKITYCNLGISFSDSPNNILRSNKLENNIQHLRISVDKLAQHNNDIDTSNTVDGKPIYYWLQKSDSTLPLDAGLVFLIDCKRITIQNLNLSSSGQNIVLHSTTDSTLQHNTIIGNGEYTGIYLLDSTKIRLIGNTIKSQANGIHLQNSLNNHINQNQIVNNTIGIEIENANNNEITNNTFSQNDDCIYYTKFRIFWSSYNHSIGNTISNNKMMNNNNGISMEGENLVKGNIVTGNSGTAIKIDAQVTLTDNIVTNNEYGIDVSRYDNILKNNTMMNNTYNLFVSGVHSNYWRGNNVVVLINNVDSSNTINGNPVYYWVGKQNERVPSDAGYILLVNCNNITVQNQNLNSNGEGIVLLNTTNSKVFGNSVSDNIIGLGVFLSKQNMISENFIKNNDDGIRIGDSINNTITLNNITLNKVWAIDFKGSQTNNSIYCNNFIDNGNGNLQVSIDKLYGLGLGNFWDNGTIGNYWSDYLQRYTNASKRINDSRIWNVPFFINEVNIDRFPLTEPVDIETKPSITETLSTTQITIVIVLIAIVGAAFLVYFLKIKKTTKPK